jgi:hypothetical protein
MASVSDLISKIKEQEAYSILCCYLYEYRDIPEYSILCELAYLLDSKSFVNLIKYFEGQTITFPTKEEFQSGIRTLLLLKYTDIDKLSWQESLKKAGFQSSEGRTAHNKLDKLKDTLKKYNFNSRQI